ncbi:hypothetical protein [Pectobacterium brasiliense]|uniref:hypothetical protein n=1 Tax=Pectobacterium brasiliense TaxID=180957 RepID=UPI001F075FAC|nr:hypothetical protein [Pectobacterium brasiliense]
MVKFRPYLSTYWCVLYVLGVLGASFASVLPMAVTMLRISGVFPLHETDRLLDAIARTLPVKVTQHFPGG